MISFLEDPNDSEQIEWSCTIYCTYIDAMTNDKTDAKF